MKLSIIIPVFNEKKTIKTIIKKVVAIKRIKKEIIIVDDYSTDGTREILKNIHYREVKKILLHNRNIGKGGAIKTARKYLNGDIVIIQDADLEYNPKDYHKLLRPFEKAKTQVVYGSRVLKKKRYKLGKGFWINFRVFANFALTEFSNFLNKQNLTDAHTCYKLFTVKLFKKIKLNENDFAFCPEITTKISNKGINIKEVPISYKGRNYSEGKKINILDAFRAVYVILKYKIRK